MARIAVGRKAPDFELITDTGETFKLSAHRGWPVVLFFYPQDDTEGCTIENVEFTACMAAFRALGTLVIGISPDTVETHRAFREKYGLQVALAADPQHRAIGSYGLWQPKKTFGRDYIGVVRSSFLIDPNGKIAAIWTVRRIKGHAEQVLEATRTLVGADGIDGSPSTAASG